MTSVGGIAPLLGACRSRGSPRHEASVGMVDQHPLIGCPLPLEVGRRRSSGLMRFTIASAGSMARRNVITSKERKEMIAYNKGQHSVGSSCRDTGSGEEDAVGNGKRMCLVSACCRGCRR